MATLNLTRELEQLISDIVSRTDEFSHIDPSRLLVCISTTRTGGVHGVYAKIHPLRFTGGSRTTEIRHGRRRCICEMPSVTSKGVEMLYLIYFLVPRFLDIPQREKLITIFHELYHVSPAFDGDIRRFPGRNYAHGSSTRRYNQLMGQLADRYLERIEDRTLLAFLDGDLSTLRSRHQAIVGRKHQVPHLRIIG